MSYSTARDPGQQIDREVDVAALGFSFCYRLSGAAPLIRRFPCSDAAGIAAGNVVMLASGGAVLAATGDAGLIGVALAMKVGAETYLEVIADEDAVYGVRDLGAAQAVRNSFR